MSFVIRLAEESRDRESMSELLRSCNLSTEGLFALESEYVVAFRSDDLVGVCGLEVDGDSALLRSLAVDSSARGIGLSRQMIDLLIQQALGRGVRRLFTFSKDTGEYFIHHGWRDVPITDALPHIDRTFQVQHYNRVGWYANERALCRDISRRLQNADQRQ